MASRRVARLLKSVAAVAGAALLVYGLGYLSQGGTQGIGATVPHVVVELKREFHDMLPSFLSGLLEVPMAEALRSGCTEVRPAANGPAASRIPASCEAGSP